MPYTKQELIQAYCRAKNCQPSDLVAHEAEIQKRLDNRRATLQAQLDGMPADAKEVMKKTALGQLALETEQDNLGVDL